MAIIIEQLSKCPICGNLLDKMKEFMLIPPLTGNTLDPLFLFSDSGVHVDCINISKYRDKFLYHIKLYHEYGSPSKLKCLIDGKEIFDSEDLLFFGLLTSDETEALYKFNYLSFNINNIKKWGQYSNFILLAKKFISEGKWKGLTDFNKLNYLIERIETRVKANL